MSPGLHFFDETIFEKAPELLGLVDLALDKHYPGVQFELPPFLQFGSWIGGDRDGNPSVRTGVTDWTLRQNALASLRHYRERILNLARSLSITERALPVPPPFRAELAQALAASGEEERIKARNPGEPYRQFLSIILRKLDARLARIEGQDVGGPGAAYENADELIHDLRIIERALDERKVSSHRSGGRSGAVEIFAFHRARLARNSPRPARRSGPWWRRQYGDEARPKSAANGAPPTGLPGAAGPHLIPNSLKASN
jgi:phosphoenolpyruvate carboxylase